MRIILEWREYKKPKLDYFKKVLDIPKTKVEFICDRLDLDFSKIKYLSSGKFGDAYKIDSKVLKLSTDRTEAKTVWHLLKEGNREGIIKYYSINQLSVKGQRIYVILMDYVTPFDKYVKGFKNSKLVIDFCYDVCEIIYKNWNSLTKEKYEELISERFDTFNSGVSNRLWDLYQKLSIYDKIDIHPWNIGVDKDGSYVIFDFSVLSTSVRKFNDPKEI